jgi:beta-galactosidase
LNIEPQNKALVKIPFTKPDLKEGVEYRLLISFGQKAKTLWADPGFEAAWDQMELPWFQPVDNKSKLPAAPVNVKEEGEKLLINGEKFTYTFNMKTGSMISLQVLGKDLIRKGPGLNVWRAPLANETDEWTYRASNIKHRVEGFGRMAATEWYSAGLDKMTFILDKFTWDKISDNRVMVNVRSISVLGTWSGAFINSVRYIIDGNGEIILENSIIPNGQMPSWLPRIGIEWILDRSLDQVQWYGRGPEENYPDRKSGYKIGVYKSTVNDMYEPYLIPQDYGLRTDNRWVRITDKNGTGLELRGNKLFNFSAHPYSADNLTKALYTYQIHPFNGTTFNFDYATSGVGCTAAGVFPEYQVIPQRYDFTVIIRPILPPTP